MSGQRMVVALIPARGGSQRLPGKNLALVGGRTLVARAIDVAHRVAEIDEVVVSSDSADILAEAARHGATAELRPPDLATASATSRAVIDSFVESHPTTTHLVLLQPTSPLRGTEEVVECLTALAHAPVAVTVSVQHHAPSWSYGIGDDGHLVAAVPSDAGPERLFQLTGSVYAMTADHVRSGSPLLGPHTYGVVTDRARAIDVDDAHDLLLAQLLDDHRRRSS